MPARQLLLDVLSHPPARSGDWSSKCRELTEETDRNGATYYKQAQEMIRQYYTMTQDTPTVEEIIEDAVYNLVQELETTDCQDSDGFFRQDAYDVIRAHLITYGTARYEEGVKAERQFILNVLDGIDIADGECNTKAIRKCLEARYVCRDYGPCYATEEENDWFVTLGAPRLCKQCILEVNEGACDKKDCKNYAKN